MRWFRVSYFILFLCAFSAGCRAQSRPAEMPPAKPLAEQAPKSDLDRRIETMVRSQLNIPPAYAVAVGKGGKSDFPGYQLVPITFSNGPASRTIEFLLSSDQKTLLRMEKIDLTKDPSSLVSTAGRPFRGGSNAKVVIVNFDDLECPYCARMHRELFPSTIEHYGDKVRIVYKDYPLSEIHPWALRAAVDTNCLGTESQDGYWNLVDYIHAHKQEVDGADPRSAESGQTLDRLTRDEATRQKVDAVKLEACLKRQDVSQIEAATKDADRLGVTATPTMYVNGERVEGVVDEQVLWTVIDRALEEQGVTPPAAATQSTPGQVSNTPTSLTPGSQTQGAQTQVTPKVGSNGK